MRVNAPGGRTGLGGGAAYALLAVALEKAVALGIALYLPRHLGLGDYGRYVLLIAYLGFFQALPDASLEAVLVARLARSGGEGRRLAAEGAVVRLLVSLVGAAVGLAVLALVTGDASLVRAGAVGAAGLAAAAANPYRAYLRSRLRMRDYVLLLAGQAAVGVGLLALVVREGGGLEAVFAALTAGTCAGLVVGRWLVGAIGWVRVGVGVARSLVADAWPLAGTTAILIGANQVLHLLLLRLHGAPAVGLLGGPNRLIDALGLAPQALMVSVLPALSQATATPGEAPRAARESARVLVIGLVPLAAALVLWPEPILVGLLGAPFAAAAPVLRLLAPTAVLGATGTVVSNLLLALGLQTTLLRVTAAAAVAMVVGGAPLVAAYGSSGAAGALLAAMVLGQVALLALAPARDHVRPVLSAASRPAFLGVVCLGAATLTHSATVAAAILFAGYPLALVATRTVTAADLRRWRA